MMLWNWWRNWHRPSRRRSYQPAVRPLEDRITPGFLAPLDYYFQGAAAGVLVGDFNGDGFPDLAVPAAFGGVGKINVLLGNGDGTFRPAVTYNAAADEVTSTAEGDFTGNGILDLVVGYTDRTYLSVFFGNGDGTFRPLVNVSTSGDTYGIAVGDFNGDGILDLAEAQLGKVAVQFGNGNGTFRPPVTYAAGPLAESVAVGDFTGDGVADLAVGNNPDFPPQQGSVSVLLGNGDGTFRSAGTYLAGVGVSDVEAGDFNGDGAADLAVANYHDNTVSVLLSNGDGTFQPAVNYAAPIQPASVAVADLNGDGIPDLTVIGAEVRVLLGNGDGTFRSGGDYAAGGAPDVGAVADFNGDGVPDLAVADRTAFYVNVLLGTGNGSFGEAPTYAAGNTPAGAAVGDFNGDGISDLAIADQGDSQGNGAGVSVLLGNGDGSFQAPATYAAGSKPESVVVGDFNGDGNLDLAVLDYGDGHGTGAGVSILLGNGDGSFQPAVFHGVGIKPESVAVGDFNGDGIPDLVVADFYGNDVFILLGNGDGSFQPARTFNADGGAASVAVGDLNGDGIPDLVVGNEVVNGLVSILLGNGDGTFRPPVHYDAGGTPGAVAVADLNGDGIPDVVAAGVYGGVTVFLGNGDGTLKPGVYHSGFSVFGGSVVVGDFNGDGVPDLAVAGAGEVGVLLGNGDGTFQAPFISYNTPSFDLAMGDFNGDGLPDLAVTSYRAAGTVSILLNDGNWSAGPGGAPHRLAPARHAALASVLMTAAQSPNRTTFPSILVSAEHQPQPKPVTRDIDTSRPASRSVAATLEHRITIRYAEDTASEGWENIAPELPALS